MQRSIPWAWLLLVGLLLLAPGPAGRFVLDLLGGLTLLLLLVPLILAASGFIGWQVLKRRLRTCPACGFTTLATITCPACGSTFDPSDGSSSAGGFGLSSKRSEAPDTEIDASQATIDVEVISPD